MTETVSYQKKIDCLVEEKTALNDKYQASFQSNYKEQLNQVLKEKEELVLIQSKMELDREQLKSKNNQESGPN